MSFNSTTYWLTNISARSLRNAECARNHRVFTVLGNDARYVVSVHTSSRGASVSTSRSVLRVADNEYTDRHHPDSAVIGASSASSNFSSFPAGQTIPRSRGPDRVERGLRGSAAAWPLRPTAAGTPCADGTKTG